MVSFIHRFFGSFLILIILSLKGTRFSVYLPIFRYDSISCVIRTFQPRLPLSLKYFSAIKALTIYLPSPPPFSSLPPRLLRFIPGVNVCVRNGVFEAGCDVDLVIEVGGWCQCVPRCRLLGSFPGESFLCEATECLLESVSGAVINQLLLEFVI